MHRGSIFIITKDNDNKFQVEKSTEFNGGMGIENLGGAIYDMLRRFKEPLLFDALIRDFDDRYFKYFDDIMTYTLDEEHKPYIDQNGNEYFEYSVTNNQFKFFKDDKGNYIYTSDSNYIKNMTNEDVTIVCSNGNYVLKPNQILIADYDECINNTRISFEKKIKPNVIIDYLDTTKYIPTKKEENTLENLVESFERLGFKVSIILENGMNSAIELEKYTKKGVPMVHTIYFFDNYSNIYNLEKVNENLKELIQKFSINKEIEDYIQKKKEEGYFDIYTALEDLESYKYNLEKDISGIITKNENELFFNKYKKSLNKEIEREVDDYEFND